MSGIRLVVAVLLATAAVEAGAAVSPADLPRSAIESCIASLKKPAAGDEQRGREVFNLGERCPALARDLQDLRRENSADDIDIDAVSLEGVRDLAAIVDGFRAPGGDPMRMELDFDGLDDLLDDVLIDETSEDSPWDRFLRWLEQHLRDEDSPRLGRFLDWLEGFDPPPWLGEVLIKTSTVLIILLALIVVGNELRLSGLPRRRRRERRQATRTQAVPTAGRTLGFDELRTLPPRALAAAIVEMLTAAFADRGWLSRDESLTNRELVNQVRTRNQAIAGPFATLLDAIDAIVYGDRAPDDETRGRLIKSTGALLAHSRRQSRGAP